jgi:hypothetical protein
MTLSESFGRVLEYQLQWDRRNTPEMQARGLLIRKTIPQLLEASALQYHLAVEGSDGSGSHPLRLGLTEPSNPFAAKRCFQAWPNDSSSHTR